MDWTDIETYRLTYRQIHRQGCIQTDLRTDREADKKQSQTDTEGQIGRQKIQTGGQTKIPPDSQGYEVIPVRKEISKVRHTDTYGDQQTDVHIEMTMTDRQKDRQTHKSTDKEILLNHSSLRISGTLTSKKQEVGKEIKKGRNHCQRKLHDPALCSHCIHSIVPYHLDIKKYSINTKKKKVKKKFYSLIQMKSWNALLFSALSFR